MKFIQLLDNSLVSLNCTTRIFSELVDGEYILRVEVTNGNVFDVIRKFNICGSENPSEIAFNCIDMQFIAQIINNFLETRESVLYNREIYQEIWSKFKSLTFSPYCN